MLNAPAASAGPTKTLPYKLLIMMLLNILHRRDQTLHFLSLSGHSLKREQPQPLCTSRTARLPKPRQVDTSSKSTDNTDTAFFFFFQKHTSYFLFYYINISLTFYCKNIKCFKRIFVIFIQIHKQYN